MKSAARALDVLDEIASGGPGTQQQLSRRLNIPKSSIHALLRTMSASGWLETDSTGTVYRLGIHSLVVSSAYLDDDPALARMIPMMNQVAAKTGETVHLGRLDGADLIYTAKRESVHPLRMHSAVGRRFPACSTAMGRAMLSELPVLQRYRLIPEIIAPITARTVTNRAEVLALVEAASARGYASENEESCVGIRCIAVALPLRKGAADSLGVAIPLSRLDGDRERFIIGTLLGVRAQIGAGRR